METAFDAPPPIPQALGKHGFGLALLKQSFCKFYKRGMKTIEPGVDAENPNGATHPYQKAGMKIANEYVIYKKELRPGRAPGEKAEQAS